MKFKITYKDGLEVIRDQSDCETVEQMVNCMFGTGHNLDELGITVKPLEEEVTHLPMSDIVGEVVVEASLEKAEAAPPKEEDKPHVVKVVKSAKVK